MRRRGGGAIVNVSSIHAMVTSGSRVAYVTSKSALLGLTKAMALDHAAEQIRVNVILPGAIDTPMLTQAWAQLRPDRTALQMRADAGHAIPIGRVGTPAEAAHAIVFLCSPHASFITGAELLVDGGLAHKLALPVMPAKT
jgi:NAD(P)-dependent dehydrogenase (short-subunit alcohol dehydrogenase family)